MRTFQHFNQKTKISCPICGTKDDKETMLVAIADDYDGERNVEAIQVHTECLQEGLWYDKEHKVIYTLADK